MADPKFDKVLSTIVCKAGIKRDGTQSDGNYYSDGQWCRFRLGRPKKIGGYREIANGLKGPIRAVYVHSKHPSQLIYTFSDDGVQMTSVDREGVGGSTVDRTPAGFVSESGYQWQVDALYDSTGSPETKIICHRSHGSHDSDEDEEYPVYFGGATDTAALTTVGVSVSGGCVVLQPFLFVYGNNGLIQNSIANDPVTFTGGDSNTANVSATKVIKGLPLRGGSNAPAGLFWSQDSLIRVSYVGGTAKWRYDTITAKSTVLSPSAIVDYDGVFFWAGVDRFFMYNGVVQEVPNPINQDFFFDNLNWNERAKVWVTTLPRWGEIWWHFPKGNSTVCNHAIIYNVRENSWYDTEISRSAGYPPRVLYFPVWADANSNDDVATDKYRIYRHETGVDAVVGEDQTAIPSFFETSAIGYATGGIGGDGTQNPNVQTRLVRVEPDFVMNGNMTAQLTGSSHAQAADVLSDPVSFDPTTKYMDIPGQRRYFKVRFSSNEAGGNYHMGKLLLHMEIGDERQ